METLQTLERGIHALELIAKQHGQMNVAQLAEQLGINRTIAYRITRTLSSLGYIKSNDQQLLELSSKVINLYQCFEMTIPASAQQVLNELSLQTQASASLVIAEGTDCVVVKTASAGAAYLKINYQLGSRHSIGIAASGIALASTYPPQAQESAAIQTARQLGYAYSKGALQAGIVGLFIPIAHRHMAIGITNIGDIDIDKVVQAVSHAARALS